MWMAQVIWARRSAKVEPNVSRPNKRTIALRTSQAQRVRLTMSPSFLWFVVPRRILCYSLLGRCLPPAGLGRRNIDSCRNRTFRIQVPLHRARMHQPQARHNLFGTSPKHIRELLDWWRHRTGWDLRTSCRRLHPYLRAREGSLTSSQHNSLRRARPGATQIP